MAPSVFIYHGQAGVWDEIILLAFGLLLMAVFLFVWWRSRGLEPELEQSAQDDRPSDRIENRG